MIQRPNRPWDFRGRTWRRFERATRADRRTWRTWPLRTLRKAKVNTASPGEGLHWKRPLLKGCSSYSVRSSKTCKIRQHRVLPQNFTRKFTPPTSGIAGKKLHLMHIPGKVPGLFSALASKTAPSQKSMPQTRR